jgi:hypothetical protein
MKTAEGILKDEVKKFFDALGAYCFMPVQSGYGKQGVDFFCCVKGLFIAIETKAPGKEPTPRQYKCLRDVGAAGGLAFFSDNIEHIVATVTMWLEERIDVSEMPEASKEWFKKAKLYQNSKPRLRFTA